MLMNVDITNASAYIHNERYLLLTHDWLPHVV